MIDRTAVRAAATAAMAAAWTAGAAMAGVDWPEFRGPRGDGHVPPAADGKPLGLPVTWSETNNVQWRTEIHDRGWSTPVVADGRIWLTTATMEGHDFFAVCVDAATGKILRDDKLFHSDNPEPLGNAVNCYAAPSPAIESGRVYIHFGSYGTACLDASSGKVLWKREDLPCRHYRGPASSVILFGNTVILTMDGVDVQYLVALDKQTGKTVWKTDRTTKWNDENSTQRYAKDGDLRKAHCTPFIAEVNGALQMLSPGAKASYAYDPRTGTELWHIRHDDAWSAAPRGLYAGNLAIVVTGLGKTELYAVRADGRGDVTDTHVAWKLDKGVCKTASPILVDGLLYLIADDGALLCLDAATGEQVWRERIGGNYAASPVYADNRLYFCSQQGKTTVLKPGRAFEPVATNQLENGFMASPAVSGKAFILRTKTHLYRIAE